MLKASCVMPGAERVALRALFPSEGALDVVPTTLNFTMFASKIFAIIILAITASSVGANVIPRQDPAPSTTTTTVTGDPTTTTIIETTRTTPVTTSTRIVRTASTPAVTETVTRTSGTTTTTIVTETATVATVTATPGATRASRSPRPSASTQ
ncbi:hypothetical protein C8T65DRAFT_829204 [Cerioporus squamosus]|nr:hypothetical protein C8T65DRAFT_829204 [Cerioporus squamosus]